MLSLPAWGWYQRFKEHATVCVASCRLVLRAQGTLWVLSKGSAVCSLLPVKLWILRPGLGGVVPLGGVSSAAIVRERWPYREALHAIAVPPYHVKRMDLIHLLLQPLPPPPLRFQTPWIVCGIRWSGKRPSSLRDLLLAKVSDLSARRRENIPSSWQLRQTSTNAPIWCTLYSFHPFSNLERKAYIYNWAAI